MPTTTALCGQAICGQAICGTAPLVEGASLGYVPLDHNMVWTDEPDWTPIRSRTRIACTGKEIVTQAKLNSGRPFTLSRGRYGGLWITRDNLDQLRHQRDTLGWTGTLTLDDLRQFTVRYDHATNNGISIEPVKLVSDPTGADKIRIILHLRETPAS